MGPSGFEPESPAPQAGRIPSYPTSPRRRTRGLALLATLLRLPGPLRGRVTFHDVLKETECLVARLSFPAIYFSSIEPLAMLDPFPVRSALHEPESALYQ